MAEEPVLIARDGRGIATVTLNRPRVGNAYDAALLEALIAGLADLAGDASLRALVLRGAGRHFAAGADLDWLAKVAEYPPEQAFQASLATTTAMQRLNEFPRPTIAVIQGACFGGGCGLACCVDVALAVPEAVFGLTEVRVGVAPTPISTQMVQAMGVRHARRYAVTGERFGAAEALRIGLVHEVVPAAEIEARLEAILGEVLRAAPGAAAVAKASLLGANGLTLDARQMALLAHEGWMQRASAEGKEGLRAFREKRPPTWCG
ncbi:enoyl-CoA hydratase-related protein [Crenalkalicoccus roseus]|uniref:enoyl-CoA hydratase-related protein n=1 Tax=Crenalkalicoccus roseus TaxID=1485588 RepID=UPI0013053C75|nr:enoyl-CoA hydratase-related protein [Crenalkalicoccus roseus]